VILGDASFFPFSPNQFSSDYLTLRSVRHRADYLFEAKKAAARLEAAKDQTAVTRSQVADNERSLTLSVHNSSST